MGILAGCCLAGLRCFLLLSVSRLPALGVLSGCFLAAFCLPLAGSCLWLQAADSCLRAAAGTLWPHFLQVFYESLSLKKFPGVFVFALVLGPQRMLQEMATVDVAPQGWLQRYIPSWNSF